MTENMGTIQGKATLFKTIVLLLLLFVFGKSVQAADYYEVYGTDTYLALRNAKAYDARNEIGKLYNGEMVELIDSSDSGYWYVRACKSSAYGYVNKKYLRYSYSDSNYIPTSNVYVVQGTDTYLALRNAKAYDANNEIGKLYNGEEVTVYDTSDPQYWYVYSAKYGTYGFVNKDYLGAKNSGTTYTVKGTDLYLALRNAKAFDSRNEIGKLRNGETVQVIDASDSTYWYVYAPSLGKNGYVNKNYLSGTGADNTPAGPTYTVYGTDIYLALRSAKAYSASNEIGKLYNGECVEVLDTSDSTYWYVYAPVLGKKGYVNKNYLRR